MNVRMFARQAGVAARLLLALTLLLGVAYPALIWAIGRAVPSAGEITDASGRPVATRLLVQMSPEIAAHPAWFHARPSAVEWASTTSGASNAAVAGAETQAEAAQARADVASAEGADPAAVPADAYTASGSGLDPDISVEYANLQVPRIAAARGVADAEVAALVARHTSGGLLAFLGQPSVNVTALNVDLASLGTLSSGSSGGDG
ncbi:potassium-transporting ATPase subunit C [Micrococcales bacterium 31B]|nr:potassium-transporting ATPase subunit C [Micrococcales bacterium 31B]